MIREAARTLAGTRALLGSDARVARVDPYRGGRVLEVELGVERAWLLDTGDGLHALSLEDDDALPGAPALGAELRAGRARLLAWRPGRRATLLRTTVDGRREIGKAYRRGRSARAARALEIAGLATIAAGFRVPRTLSHDDALDTLTLELLPGQPLLLRSGHEEQWFRIGAALRKLQAATLDDVLARHGAREELAALDGLLARLLPVLEGPPEGYEELRGRLAAACEAMPPHDPVLTHRDLHDGQLLEDGHTAALLDFDLLCAADPLLDAANLSAHLLLRSMQGQPDDGGQFAERSAEMLLDGLARYEERGFAMRLRFYQCATFLRLSVVYAARPIWAGIVPLLVNAARRCSDELD